MPKNIESIYPIIINSSCYLGGNKFRYTFPKGSVDFKNTSIAVDNVQLFYSWFNITSNYGNNTFSFDWPTLAGSTTYNVTIPDGFYSVNTLNTWLQNYCIANNLYLISGSNNVYYIELITNSTYYSIQLNLYDVPSTLPSGYTAPSGFTFPVAPTKPIFKVLTTPFSKWLGFPIGNYTAASQISSMTPQVSPVQSIILQCSMLDNRFSYPSTNLYSFSSGTAVFGGMISSAANDLVYVDVMDSSVSYFDISLVDQEFNQIQFRDSNIVIQLIIKVIN
jgi:hypothetical protein